MLWHLGYASFPYNMVFSVVWSYKGEGTFLIHFTVFMTFSLGCLPFLHVRLTASASIYERHQNTKFLIGQKSHLGEKAWVKCSSTPQLQYPPVHSSQFPFPRIQLSLNFVWSGTSNVGLYCLFALPGILENWLLNPYFSLYGAISHVLSFSIIRLKKNQQVHWQIPQQT